jgi:predicted O-linked N-acetylglucosamine transferase (SPINDLY family)
MIENLPLLVLEIIHLIKNDNLEKNSNLILACVKSSSQNQGYLYDVGVECVESGRISDAIIIFNCLKSFNPYDARIPYNLGYIHTLKHDYQSAFSNFNEAFKISPNDLDILINNANALHELKRFDDALAFFDKALTLDSNCAQALTNKGLTLLELEQYYEAMVHHDKALSIDPKNHIIWANKASLMKQLRQHGESAKCYLRASELCTSNSYFLGQAHHQMMLICDWTDYEYFTNRIFDEIELGNKSAEPFGFQGIAKSESLLQKCAEIYSNDVYPRLGNLAKNSKHKHKKIHIGYLCGEFREHASSILMARIWELHDKEKFKTFAFDSGYGDNSEYRQRIDLAFDKIYDISQLSDLEAANLIYSNEIDILINLNGFFGYERQGVFSYKPSPIQVNFLGFPGTLGASYFDYMIADNVIVPVESRQFYSEKIIYLPNAYQPNDCKRKISHTLLSKSDAGLPEHSFVFACFNNSYKITPKIFDLWSAILRRVDNSVLWLLVDNSPARENLIKEAAARGINQSRIIFADRLQHAEHLARHQLADLFLDTLPYNAHTTSSDSLWCGLPVLTLIGKTFPGRVTASLLYAVGLEELITYTTEEYENVAVELASNPSKIELIKTKLIKNIPIKPLFDSNLYTNNLEAAYMKIYQYHQADLPPNHISIV